MSPKLLINSVFECSVQWQFAHSNWHFLISSQRSFVRSLLLFISCDFCFGSLWWKWNAPGWPINPHLSHLPPNFSTNSIFDFHLLFETEQEPHIVLCALSLFFDGCDLNSLLQCLHLHILASSANMYIPQVPPVGIEPTTPRLKVFCAACCATEAYLLDTDKYTVHRQIVKPSCNNLKRKYGIIICET